MSRPFLADISQEITHEFQTTTNCSDKDADTLTKILYERLEQFAKDVLKSGGVRR